MKRLTPAAILALITGVLSAVDFSPARTVLIAAASAFGLAYRYAYKALAHHIAFNDLLTHDRYLVAAIDAGHLGFLLRHIQDFVEIKPTGATAFKTAPQSLQTLTAAIAIYADGHAEACDRWGGATHSMYSAVRCHLFAVRGTARYYVTTWKLVVDQLVSFRRISELVPGLVFSSLLALGGLAGVDVAVASLRDGKATLLVVLIAASAVAQGVAAIGHRPFLARPDVHRTAMRFLGMSQLALSLYFWAKGVKFTSEALPPSWGHIAGIGTAVSLLAWQSFASNSGPASHRRCRTWAGIVAFFGLTNVSLNMIDWLAASHWDFTSIRLAVPSLTFVIAALLAAIFPERFGVGSRDETFGTSWRDDVKQKERSDAMRQWAAGKRRSGRGKGGDTA